MKKFLTFTFLIFCLAGLILPRGVLAMPNETSCRERGGTWLKVPIPILIDRTIPGTGEKLSDRTANGHCISDPAILLFMLYYIGLVLMGVVAVVIITIGGYNYLTSFGRAEATKRAKTQILYAFGGLCLGLASYIILNFINPDLVSFRWNPEKVSKEFEEAFKKIEEFGPAGAGRCPENSIGDCRSTKIRPRNIGDVCTVESKQGYCKLEANIEQAGWVCVCNEDKTNCTNNCGGANPDDCLGKACLKGGKQGRCLKNVANNVSCEYIEDLCKIGDCGADAKKQWPDLDCSGMYDCTTGGAKGLCLGSGGSCETLYNLCSRFKCTGNEYKGTGELKKKCHGEEINLEGGSTPTNVCFNGKYHLLVSDPNGQCTTEEDVQRERACKGAAGSYGMCKKGATGIFICEKVEFVE